VFITLSKYRDREEGEVAYIAIVIESRLKELKYKTLA